MKVLFFIDSLSLGGKERRLTELMKDLKGVQGVNFELVLMYEDIHYKEVLSLGIKIHYIIRKTKKDITVFRKIYKICKQFKPDVLHCWDSMTAVYSVPASRLLGIKLVNGMVIDTPVTRNVSNKYWFRAKLTFPFSHIIVGNSLAGLHAYGAPLNKSLCIYNGLDLKRFNHLKEAEIVKKELLGSYNSETFIIGMVAAFEERKDYNTLIDAALSLITKHNALYFILVGDGITLNDMKGKVPQPAAEKILFLGRRDDIESIVNILDIAVLLTNSNLHGEGISNSIIEYMALGKPVIANFGGGTDELIKNGENGMLIESKKPALVIDSIETLMLDRNLRESLGQNGKQTIIEKFDVRIMTKNYINLYERIINNQINIG